MRGLQAKLYISSLWSQVQAVSAISFLKTSSFLSLYLIDNARLLEAWLMLLSSAIPSGLNWAYKSWHLELSKFCNTCKCFFEGFPDFRLCSLFALSALLCDSILLWSAPSSDLKPSASDKPELEHDPCPGSIVFSSCDPLFCECCSLSCSQANTILQRFASNPFCLP